LKTLGDDGAYPFHFRRPNAYRSTQTLIDANVGYPSAAAIALYTKKIDEYAAGYGTVLFFEDQAVLEAWGKNMPP
jgi:predicted oxidoreductase (fatty acid repression mutant protein)